MLFQQSVTWVAIALGLVTLIPAIVSSPAPLPEPAPVPASPYDPERPTTPGSSCTCRTITDHLLPALPLALRFDVYIPGQTEPSLQGSGSWGGGFLDNLRTQCRSVWLWEAHLDEVDAPHTGVHATFVIPRSSGTGNVQDAAWLGSDPNNRIYLTCTGSCKY